MRKTHSGDGDHAQILVRSQKNNNVGATLCGRPPVRPQTGGWLIINFSQLTTIHYPLFSDWYLAISHTFEYITHRDRIESENILMYFYV